MFDRWCGASGSSGPIILVQVDLGFISPKTLSPELFRLVQMHFSKFESALRVVECCQRFASCGKSFADFNSDTPPFLRRVFNRLHVTKRFYFIQLSAWSSSSSWAAGLGGGFVLLNKCLKLLLSSNVSALKGLFCFLSRMIGLLRLHQRLFRP